MELEKIRNLGDHELAVEEKKAAEQLFRLRFQLKLGQTDAIKKVRLLRKEIARFETVARERELGLHGAEHMADSVSPKETEKKSRVSKAKPAKKAPAKKAAAKSHVSKARRGVPAKKAVKKSTTKKEAR